MLKSAALLLVFTLLAVLMPALASLPQQTQTPPQTAFLPQDTKDPQQSLSAAAQQLTVYDEAVGQAVTLDMRQYLISALLCEMPLSFHDEALKAQVVASRSYALYCAQRSSRDPADELMGAAFAVNSAAGEGIIGEAEAKARFGSSYYLSVEKAAAIVDSVDGQLLCWQGEPAAAAYHAISAGKTQPSGDVWSEQLPYLISADSAADMQAEGYESSAAVSLGEFCDRLHGINPAFSPAGDAHAWLQDVQRNEAGYVLQLTLCGAVFTGAQLRDAFSLRSSCFALQLTQEEALFTVYGYGHGVGMSQTGAQAMAQAGSSCRDILAHYYPGTLLQTQG